MKTKKLTEVLERIEAWPPEAQNQLADFVLELDAELSDGEYEPTPEEMAGIDRGLRAAAEGRFATPQQVEAAFAKFRARMTPVFDASQFDAAIERDAQAGKLDALAEEALAEHRAGGSREL